MMSFIIPAKNVSAYIDDCLMPFKKVHGRYDFEVIIIDDHSSDNTFAKISQMSRNFPCIRVYKNTGQGKVQALNYGFSLSSGHIIKCVDSDDIVSEDIFPLLASQASDEALMHDATIVDSKLKPVCYFTSNAAIISATYNETVEKILSPPRWAWSFSRDISEQIFPMPENLPYEDVWFSFSIKKYAKKIKYIPKSLYLYRQHSSQTFGGVFNFSEKVVRFRAQRMIHLLPIIQTSQLGREISASVFEQNIYFYKYVSKSPWKVRTFFRLKVSKNIKIRFFLILFFPRSAELLQSLLWKYRNKN